MFIFQNIEKGSYTALPPWCNVQAGESLGMLDLGPVTHLSASSISVFFWKIYSSSVGVSSEGKFTAVTCFLVFTFMETPPGFLELRRHQFIVLQ